MLRSSTGDSGTRFHKRGMQQLASERDNDVPLLRKFAGLDAFEDVMPDKITILRFCHLLEKHNLPVRGCADVSAVLSEKELSMKRGTVVDATLMAAPGSTMNEDKKRDPEMTQTKKGNQWHFGIKAHIDVDAERGVIHTVECTAAKVADITMMEACLQGKGEIALGDRGYHKTSRTIEHFAKEGNLAVLRPTKMPVGGEMTEKQKSFNRMLSAAHAIVEHPSRVVKRQFGYVKVCYHGLAKNTGHIVTLFALANMWLVRKRLFDLLGEVRP